MTTSLSHKQLQTVANTIRGLAMDAVQKANSGHPGLPMGMADVAATLWLRNLRYSTVDPLWQGRDRFVLSAGHGSTLLYALLHLAGFDLPMAELKAFRQLDSMTPGHPEYGHPGVETTTGPLGQGLGNGVGMALAAKMEAAQFAQPMLENRVFGIVSDGDLMEGISSECASLAGHLGLGNLVYFYDDNKITIDGSTENAFTENVGMRFEAFGWHVLQADGHDFTSIEAALDAGIAETRRPTLVVTRTTIGKGSPNKAGTAGVHGAPLGPEEIALTKAALGLPAESFAVSDEVRALWTAAGQHKEAERSEWQAAMNRWAEAEPEQARSREAFHLRTTPKDLLEQLVAKLGETEAATRALSGQAIQAAAELVPSLVGGSADLDASCKTDIKSSKHVTASDASGRNLHFGIREHAMGAILNGISLHGGFLPMGSTFLVFSDYMRPAIRLAALMNLPVGFVFTHDSLMVGEDGPTHQPVEQIAALRLIPNLHVFRPADAIEVAAAWTHLLERRTGPVALSLTRQSLPYLKRPAGFTARDVLRGGYVVHEPQAAATCTILATGSEVATAVGAVNELAAKGVHARVVSIPCLELFLAQEQAWRRQCIAADLPVFAIEMGRPESWYGLTRDPNRVIGLQRFGTSAPAKIVAEEFGFTPAAVAEFVAQSLA